MSNEPVASRIAALLRTLTPKSKQPASATVLNNWIAQAEGKLGPEARGGRLGWLIASSVAIAAVQRAIDADGQPFFLLKGGTLLQHRLNSTARTTKDIDGLIRGDLDAFVLALEGALAEPWGPLTLRRIMIRRRRHRTAGASTRVACDRQVARRRGVVPSSISNTAWQGRSTY